MTGFVFGFRFRFIALGMLFINDNETDVLHRSENRAPCTNNDFEFPILDAMPLVHLLALIHF